MMMAEQIEFITDVGGNFLTLLTLMISLSAYILAQNDPADLRYGSENRVNRVYHFQLPVGCQLKII
ncbi:hypothetical protein [Geoglobus ahangari]|uniref:hypothetical protein n=1 Tax=Geoglobus ahangari TaxID=113653 RepID=UPI00064E743E|nr:hypothetical protein [Geoglobus ahangari]